MSLAARLGLRAIQVIRYVSPFTVGYVERVVRVRWRRWEVRVTLMSWEAPR